MFGQLADKGGVDQPIKSHGYPHFYYIDDQPLRQDKLAALELSGENVHAFANYAFTSNVEALSPGQSQPTRLVTPKGTVDGVLHLLEPGKYQFSFDSAHFGLAATWLRDLSDGYVAIDQDVSRRIPGPVVVTESLAAPIEHDGRRSNRSKQTVLYRESYCSG